MSDLMELKPHEGDSRILLQIEKNTRPPSPKAPLAGAERFASFPAPWMMGESDIAIRKWCVEQAVRIGPGDMGRMDSMLVMERAADLYDWVMQDEPAEPAA